MKKLFSLIILTAAFFSFSCGEKFDEIKNAAEVIKNAPQAAEDLSKAVDLSEKKMEERKAKGDTLALHFTELQKYLPESISGFKAGEPEGQTTSAGEFSMSSIERTYESEDNSGRNIKITLLDYNESYAMFAGVAYWATLGISTETNDGFQKSFKTDNNLIAGYEEYSKSSKSAKINYAIGYRFLLTIEEYQASGTDVIKDVAKKINLNKLAEM
jgi:hypothetical protein